MTAARPLLGLSPDDDFVVVVRGDTAEVCVGSPFALESVLEIDELVSEPGDEVFVAIPFAQARENGCRVAPSEQEQLVGLRVTRRHTLAADALAHLLPGGRVATRVEGFEADDDAFAAQVAAVQAEIGAGAGSNFVVHRNYVCRTDLNPAQAALRLLRRLLHEEMGAYWQFALRIGDVVLVGASPEKHLSRDGAGRVEMNPISGTLRVGSDGSEAELEAFLRDAKERDELAMVVDEELKMMAQVCHDVPVVHGPSLRRLARVVHTEFTLSGASHLSVGALLRCTLMAPTLTGSPLRNAFEVIDRCSTSTRGYYGGVLARVAHGTPLPVLDSCVIIRTAHIESSGRIVVGAGATIVRGSVPESECAETAAKIGLIRYLLGSEDAA